MRGEERGVFHDGAAAESRRSPVTSGVHDGRGHDGSGMVEERKDREDSARELEL